MADYGDRDDDLDDDNLDKARYLVQRLGKVLQDSGKGDTVSSGSYASSSNKSSGQNFSFSHTASSARSSSSRSSSVSLAPNKAPSTPREVHQSLFGYKNKTAGTKRRSTPTIVDKRPKLVPWTQIFVCLAYTDTDKVPADYSLLTANGLGKQTIRLYESSTAMEIHEALLIKFPKLKSAGGYDFLRTYERSKQLEVIVCGEEGFSASYLKSVLGQAKCFIRPIQHDIVLDECPAKSLQISESVPRIKCETCKEMIPMILLSNHYNECKEKSNSDNDNCTITMVEEQALDVSYRSGSITPPCYSPISDHFLPNDNEDYGVVGTDTILSIDTIGNDDLELPPVIFHTTPPQTLIDIINLLRSENNVVVPNGGESYETLRANDNLLDISVRRKKFMEDALREVGKPKFCARKIIKVRFINEEAVDTGGPRRDFYRLLVQEGKEYFCKGSGDSLSFQPNTVFCQKDYLKGFGIYVAMSLLQEGYGFPVFHPSIYNYITMGKYKGVSMLDECVPDLLVRQLLLEMKQCTCDKELQKLFDNDIYMDYLLETGFKKPVNRITLRDMQEMSETFKYHVLKASVPEMNQFAEGLESLGVLKYMKKYPDIMRKLFVNENYRLTAGEIKDFLSKILYSRCDTKRIDKEEATIIFFNDYLDDCEANLVKTTVLQDDMTEKEQLITTGHVLTFFTGTDRIIPGGFHKNGTITFHEDKLATSNACDFILRLPIGYDCKEDFYNMMNLCIVGSALSFGHV